MGRDPTERKIKTTRSIISKAGLEQSHPEAQGGIIEFLLEYDKQATIEESALLSRGGKKDLSRLSEVGCLATYIGYVPSVSISNRKPIRVVGHLFLTNIRNGEKIYFRQSFLPIFFLYTVYDRWQSYDLTRYIGKSVGLQARS
jgi:hypothetical protein